MGIIAEINDGDWGWIVISIVIGTFIPDSSG
jgi:hypothetical protein